MYTYIYIYTKYICIYIYIQNTCICICIYIYRERERDCILIFSDHSKAKFVKITKKRNDDSACVDFEGSHHIQITATPETRICPNDTCIITCKHI